MPLDSIVDLIQLQNAWNAFLRQFAKWIHFFDRPICKGEFDIDSKTSENEYCFFFKVTSLRPFGLNPELIDSKRYKASLSIAHERIIWIVSRRNFFSVY